MSLFIEYPVYRSQSAQNVTLRRIQNFNGFSIEFFIHTPDAPTYTKTTDQCGGLCIIYGPDRTNGPIQNAMYRGPVRVLYQVLYFTDPLRGFMRSRITKLAAIVLFTQSKSISA